MNIGKVPENVLKRSILKQIVTKRSEVLVGAGVGEDCAVLQLKEDEVFVVSTDPITGVAKDIGKYAIQINANDIASSGAEPVGMLVTALLPPDVEEADIRTIMTDLETSCKSANVQLIGGHTEVTDAVNRVVLSITGIGKVKKDLLVKTGGAKPGDDVVITKWIGIEGTTILANEHEEELLKRFPSRMIYEAKNFDQYLSVIPEAALAVKSGVTAMHDVTEGGIMGALWELAESSGVGLEIDLKKIPVKQETIEICNYFDINPYHLISSGSMLMTTKDSTKLCQVLKEAGIAATVVGKCTDSNDRVLVTESFRRFLEPPKTDEIYKRHSAKVK